MSMVSRETGEVNTSEVMSFRNKKNFFEQEIVNMTKSVDSPERLCSRKFSYLQDHEVDKLKTEDVKRSTGLTTEDLLKNVRESMDAFGFNHETQITNLSKVSQNTVNIEERDSRVKDEIQRHNEPTEEQIEKQRRSEAMRRARRQSLEEDERRSHQIYSRSQKLREGYYGAPLTPQHSPSHRATRLIGRSSSFNRSSTLPRNSCMTSSLVGDSSSLRRNSATLPRHHMNNET